MISANKRYGLKFWKKLIPFTRWLPFLALIDGKIICTPSGFSPFKYDIERINDIKKPVEVTDNSNDPTFDITWNYFDKDVEGWEEEEGRSCTFIYGKSIVDEILKQNDGDLIINAGMVVEDGGEINGFGRLISVFSTPNYGNEFQNMAAVLEVKDNHDIKIHYYDSFEVFRRKRNHKPT